MTRYRAFISYRHADNKQEGRQWATWLHQAIETYQIPNDLVGTKNANGDLIPERIFPIFRDEEELPAHADLGSAITRALDQTDTLIVLCSPRAVQSTYVADEIDYFKRLGRSDSIIAAMIDGEPNSSWDNGKQTLGFDVADECFPTPLQFAYDQQGPTKHRAEPVAADFRINIDGKTEQGWTSPEAYRQHLVKQSVAEAQIEHRVQDYRSQLNLMLLKIIAGILGVPLGQLTQRDQAYQLALEKQRAKKLRRWLSAVASLALIAIISGVWAFTQQQAARQSQAVAEQRLQQRQIADAERLSKEAINDLDNQDTKAAIEKLVAALPEDLDNPEWPINSIAVSALNRAMAQHREVAIFEGPPEKVTHLYHLSGERLLVITDNSAQVYTTNGNLIYQWELPSFAQHRISDDQSKLTVASIYTVEKPSQDALQTEYDTRLYLKHYDLNDGTTEIDINQTIGDKDDTYRALVTSNDSRLLFSPSGSHWLISLTSYNRATRSYDYWLTIIDTVNGAVLKKYPVKQTYLDARLLTNLDVITHLAQQSSTTNTYDETLTYFNYKTSKPTVLWSSEYKTGCSDGQLVKVDDTYNNYFKLAINYQLNQVVGAWKENSYSDYRCFKTWQLDDLSSSSIISLNKDIRGPNIARAIPPSVTNALPSIFPIYAHNGAEIIISGSGSFRYQSTGGTIDAMSMNLSTSVAWYAAADSKIRGVKLSDVLATGLLPKPFPSRIAFNNDFVVWASQSQSANDNQSSETAKTFDIFTNNLLSTNGFTEIQIAQSFDSYPDLSIYSPKTLAITHPVEQPEQFNDQRSVQLSLINLETGQKSGGLIFNSYSNDAPESIADQIAYIYNGNAFIFDLNTQQTIKIRTIPGWNPNELFVANNEFYLVAYDDNFDDWSKRVISIFKIDKNNQELELVTRQKAQGIDVKSMKNNPTALILWDISYDKPKVFQALTHQGEIKPINSDWNTESYVNIDTLSLNRNATSIFVYSAGRTVSEYSLDGRLINESITQSNEYSLELTSDAKYLWSENDIIPLSTAASCDNLTEEGFQYRFSPKSKYLAKMSGEQTKVVDLSSCTAIFDLDKGSYSINNLHITDSGRLLLLSEQQFINVETVKPLIDNFSNAKKVISMGKNAKIHE